MVLMNLSVCLFAFFIRDALAYGDYVPESLYLINEDGYELQRVHVRNKRDVQNVISRIKRGGGAYSYSGSSSGAGNNAGYSGSHPGLAEIQSNIDNIAKTTSDMTNKILSHVNNIGNTGLGSGVPGFTPYSFSGSSGQSGSSGYESGGPSQSSDHSGTSGHSGGSQPSGQSGPQIFSRSGYEKGTGIKVSSAAQGPHAAFSYSSSAADGQGNLKYNLKSGQY